MDVQVDRLSSLPTDLIHLILSFLDIKDAIQTIALSSRYRFIWTSLPYLNFSDNDFLTLDKFFKFVNRVLSRRDTKIEVNSLKLRFCGKIRHRSVKSILNYTFFHNVQQMSVAYLGDRFPLSLFSSQSLKHLTLSGATDTYTTLMSTWELPALKTLHLDYIIFDDVFTDLFSKCLNLENLTLSYCYINYHNMRKLADYDICHPRLSNLTLNYDVSDYNYVLNVDAPQLKNLTIKDWSPVHLRSAPKLHSLVFKGYHTHIWLNLPNGFCSLEKADLCFYKPDYEEGNAHKVVDLLQQVRSVKYLRLNMETIKILSSFKELISHQPFSFANLTSVKVYPHDTLSMGNQTRPIEMNLSKNSSGAALTFVYEEIIALRNAESAEDRMAKLWVILEEQKAYFETIESPAEENKLDIEGRMKKFKISWKDIDEGINGTSYIFHMLDEIEELLLRKLPSSKRDTLHACFSSLLAEVDTVVKQIIDCMKIKCDEKQSHLSDHIHELLTTYEPSS